MKLRYRVFVPVRTPQLTAHPRFPPRARSRWALHSFAKRRRVIQFPRSKQPHLALLFLLPPLLACGSGESTGPQLEPVTARVTVHVRDDLDAPIGAIPVTLTHGTTTRSGATGATGAVTFDSLPAGTGTVAISVPPAYRADATSAFVTLTRGATAAANFRLVLRSGTLVIEAHDSVGGVVADAVVDVTANGGAPLRVTTNGKGSATIQRLPVATYTVEISGAGLGGFRSTATAIVVENQTTTAQFVTPPATLGSWRIDPALPFPRASLAAVSNGNVMFALGGAWPEVLRLDGNAWVTETNVPELLNAPAAAMVGNEIVLIGGFLGSGNVPTDRVRIYNTVTKTWREGERMPTARGGIQAVVLDNRIHVIGGGNQVQTLDAHEVFDLATGTWSSRAALPTSRGNPALAVFGGRIYAIGGGSGGQPFSNVDIYDPATNTWSAGPQISAARVAARALVYRDRLYVFGGEQSTGSALSDVKRLNAAGTAWETMSRMPTGRSYAGAAVFNDAVYIIGGSMQAPTTHSAGGSATVESFILRR